MRTPSIRWGRAVVGAVIAEAAQIALTVLWVTGYSLVLAPGQPEAAYQAHARVAGPWVSILGGAPLFYAASRWIARGQATARALFALFLVLDLGLLLVLPAGRLGPGIIALMLISFATKLLACDLGGRHAARGRALAPLDRAGEDGRA